MKKSLIALSTALILSLTGCGADSSKDSASTNSDNGVTATSDSANSGNSGTSTASSTSYLDKNAFKANYQKFTMQDAVEYTTLFNVNGSSMVFPNWDDNNNISLLNEPYKEGIINTSDVKDFVTYPTNSLAVINNVVYFADSSKNNVLASVDLSNKAYNQVVPKVKVSNIIMKNNVIYFIDMASGNRIHAYDTTKKTHATICFDNVGKYLVDDNVILYENKSDKSTLYKINIDGTEKEKLTDFAVNSFAPDGDKILAINGADNNNLYSISLEDLSVQRLAVMNGEDLKVFKNKFYFINVDDNRHLSQLTVDFGSNNTPNVTFDDISNDAVNEYYPTEKGIFIQRGANVDNGYALIQS